jgi:hypothetical protein
MEAWLASAFPLNLNRLDHITLLHLIHHVHPFNHTRKDRIGVIEPEIVYEVNVDLRMARIAAAR